MATQKQIENYATFMKERTGKSSEQAHREAVDVARRIDRKKADK